MRRLALILVSILVALSAAAGATAWLVLRTTPSIVVILKSEPAQAAVFSGQETLGMTPLTLKIPRGGKLSLHLVRKDCRDADVVVSAADYAMPSASQRLRLKPPLPPYDRTVKMESATDAELIVKAHPAGTEVFLDGHQLGMTPLAPVRVAPGAHTLRLTETECFPLTENLTINAGQSLVVERTLVNKVVAFYREQIRKEPAILVHVAELAHHYILRAEFAEAAQALRDAFPQLAAAEAYQQQKYFEEMTRFYTDYYVRPKGDDAVLRKACREIMAEAQEKKITNQQQLTVCIKQLEAYDKAHPAK